MSQLVTYIEFNLVGCQLSTLNYLMILVILFNGTYKLTYYFTYINKLKTEYKKLKNIVVDTGCSLKEVANLQKKRKVSRKCLS